MALGIDLNNAQFRQFVQFAERQANPRTISSRRRISRT